MSKKIILLAVLLCCLAGLMLFVVACNEEESTNPDDNQNVASTSYIIQYTDNTGTYNIEVTPGVPYSMPNIPQKEGYEFTGLYDAETGGTQYVNAQGTSLSPFTDNKNIVLFAQFRAKKYTIVLDYQGAAVSDVRELQVAYGSRISTLPTGLVMEHKVFSGWYTEPNKKGVQIADSYGVIPDKSIVSSVNFDLSDPNGFIRLYAGFTGEMHTVTFNFEEGMSPEEMSVEHGTPISQVVPITRVNEKAVLVWSKEPNDSDRSALFTGRVESDIVLYAQEYAPVIDFDANGGEEVTSIVARAGSAISLPAAVRENWQFAGWYTMGNASYTATAMPTDSVKLKAKWLPMLIFDERGGTLVDDIGAEQGTGVTLPATAKDGYIFAGWYTEQGEKYEVTAMPQTSIKLVAKYYQIKEITKIVIEAGKAFTIDRNYQVNANEALMIDMSDLSAVFGQKIKVSGSMLLKYSGTSAGTSRKMAIDFYSSNVLSEKNLLSRHIFSVNSSEYVKYTFETEWKLSGNCLACFYLPDGYFQLHDAYWSDFWVEIEYPDMSNLY